MADNDEEKDLRARAEKRAAWKKELWASKTAKKVEKMEPGEVDKTDPETNPNHWRHHRAAHDGANREYVQAVAGSLEQAHQITLDAIDRGVIIEAGKSGDPTLEAMQRVIDEMGARIGAGDQTPKLLVHKDDSPFMRPETPMSVMLREYIDISEDSKLYFVQHPEQFKAAMALAMGEYINGGTLLPNKIETAITPPNQKAQALAARVGAIVHGNPRQFAEEIHKLNMRHVDNDDKLTRHSMTHLSINGGARMLNKWADILEDQGAVDAKGNVILEKAGEVMERSEGFTSSYLNALLQFDAIEPKKAPGR